MLRWPWLRPARWWIGAFLAAAGQGDGQETRPPGAGVAATTVAGRADRPVALTDLGGHPQQRVYCLAFSPDGKTLASGSLDRAIKLWDVEAKSERASIDEGDVVLALAFSPDGKALASAPAGRPGSISIRDPATGDRLGRLSGREAPFTSLAYSPDGKTLAAGGLDRSTTLWDVASGTPRRRLEGQSDPVLAVAYSPDGKILATGSGKPGRTVMIWELPEGRPSATLFGQGSQVTSIAFAPDGKTFASAGSAWSRQQGNRVGLGPGEVLLWDSTTLEQTAAFGGHEGLVHALAFSPDGKTLATGGSGQPLGALILRDMPGGRERLRVSPRPRGEGPSQPDTVTALAFSPGGRWLAAGLSDGGVVLLDVLGPGTRP